MDVQYFLTRLSLTKQRLELPGKASRLVTTSVQLNEGTISTSKKVINLPIPEPTIHDDIPSQTSPRVGYYAAVIIGWSSTSGVNFSTRLSDPEHPRC